MEKVALAGWKALTNQCTGVGSKEKVRSLYDRTVYDRTFEIKPLGQTKNPKLQA
jgi:hypothetical protein